MTWFEIVLSLCFLFICIGTIALNFLVAYYFFNAKGYFNKIETLESRVQELEKQIQTNESAREVIIKEKNVDTV